jgi:hypothetical protein
MRLDRTQTENYEKYRTTWAHPDGVVWKAVGTLVFPDLTVGGLVVHAVVGMRKRTALLAMVTERSVSLVLNVTGGGAQQVDIVGSLGNANTPGTTVSYESDLAAADVRFTPSVVGSAVHLLVEAQWPALVGGESLEIVSDVWWE